MAERRMFAKSVIDCDDFLDMPAEAQLLYFHLAMRADDDGFVTPKKIMRMIGAKDDSLKLLIAKKFIIPFDTGVIVIRHWRINNYLQNDRYRETTYVDEKKQLEIVNKKYELKPLFPECIQDGYTGKDRIGKDSLGEIEESNSLRSLSSSCPEPSAKSSEPVPEEELIDKIFIKLNTNRIGETFAVTEGFVSQMKELYPAVDVEQELRNMKAWLMSNPQRRKTFKGIPKFINSWLAREQDKGFVSPQVQKPARTAPDYTPGFKVEEEVMDLGR